MAEDIHATKTDKLIGANIVLILLSGIAVALRFWSRKISRVGFWYDDYTILLALLPAWMMPMLNLIAVHYDFGKHVAVARPDAVEKWFYILYIFENLYAPTIAIVKFSILLFYARIFTEHTAKMQQQIWFTRALYTMAAITATWWIASQFIVIFECTPIHYFWDREPGTGHCLNVQKFFDGQAVPNIVTDVILLALPLPLIWNLQLPANQKIALSGVFLLGSFVTATSIYRLTLLVKLTQVDITWNYVEAAIWSAVEPNVAVISACLPMLRPLLKRLSENFGTHNRTSESTSTIKAKANNSSTTRTWDAPWARSSTEPIVKDPAGPFVRLPESSSSAGEGGPGDTYQGRGGEAWEMWEGGGGQRRSGDARRMNLVKSGGRVLDPLDEAERGKNVPMGKIHVRHDIELRDERGGTGT